MTIRAVSTVPPNTRNGSRPRRVTFCEPRANYKQNCEIIIIPHTLNGIQALGYLSTDVILNIGTRVRIIIVGGGRILIYILYGDG